MNGYGRLNCAAICCETNAPAQSCDECGFRTRTRGATGRYVKTLLHLPFIGITGTGEWARNNVIGHCVFKADILILVHEASASCSGDRDEGMLVKLGALLRGAGHIYILSAFYCWLFLARGH